jgi:hypothetical protein
MEEIDWTGVRPARRTVEPLSSANFAERLQRLSEQAKAIEVLRAALALSRTDGAQLPLDPSATSQR